MSVRSLRYNTIEQHFTKGVTASTDRDALAFLEAAQIYNTNQQRAIVNLVRSLKRTGLWSKMKAIYPFVGGTASSHKWNLKDPRDVDAAFRLTFSGGWTHSANGADPNGTSGYANTFLQPNSVIATKESTHLSIYHREDRSSTDTYAVSIGSQNNDGSGRCYIVPREGEPPSNTTFVTVNGKYIAGNSDFANFTDTTSIGYYLASRTQLSTLKSHKNGIEKASNTTFNANALNNFYIYIAAFNSGGTAFYFSKIQIAFATIGDGLTDDDATNLYNIVDLYQKRLGRAV